MMPMANVSNTFALRKTPDFKNVTASIKVEKPSAYKITEIPSNDRFCRSPILCNENCPSSIIRQVKMIKNMKILLQPKASTNRPDKVGPIAGAKPTIIPVSPSACP